MALDGIGKRYALALFNAAVAEDVLEQVYGDVTSFDRVLAAERPFQAFLTSLRVTPEAKKDLVVRAVGDRASGLFVKFVHLLIDKKRMSGFADVAAAFASLYEEHLNIIRVGLVTAIPLDAAAERKAREMIERRTGKTARIEKRVDPAIIGGMIVFAGDRIMDGSIRSRLFELRKELLETRVS
jgi:F-type H+-transporting ATPase subunit delta